MHLLKILITKLCFPASDLMKLVPATAIILIGLFVGYLSLFRFVEDYYCLPTSKEELNFERGVLTGVAESFRRGGSFVHQRLADERIFSTAITAQLRPLIGQEILIGTTDGPFFCSADVLHIEHQGNIIQDASISIENRKKGRWFDFVVLAFLGPLAFLSFAAGCRMLRDIFN